MDMNLDEDDFSEDYDFMDDSDDAEQQRERRAAERLPQKKYITLLQRVADRMEKEITIDLDDLVVVRTHNVEERQFADIHSYSMNKACGRMVSPISIWSHQSK